MDRHQCIASRHAKLAYTYDEAAEACGVSRDVINREVAKGNLVPSYPTSRPVLLVDDLREWLANLPSTHPRDRA